MSSSLLIRLLLSRLIIEVDPFVVDQVIPPCSFICLLWLYLLLLWLLCLLSLLFEIAILTFKAVFNALILLIIIFIIVNVTVALLFLINHLWVFFLAIILLMIQWEELIFTFVNHLKIATLSNLFVIII